VDAFLDSGDFARTAPRTQQDYRLWAGRFSEEFGRLEQSAWEDRRARGLLIAWRDRWSSSPKQADYAVTVAVRILSWAEGRAIIGAHTCGGIERLYRASRADVVWLPDYVHRFMEVAPDCARRILTVALETGLRPGDLVTFGRAQVHLTPKGRRALVPTAKSNGRQMQSIPVSPALAAVIDSTPPGRDLILVSERGHPLTERRASFYIKNWRDRADLPKELHLYDARGTAATRLLAAGATMAEIASAMGWSIRTASTMIERYAAIAPEMADSIRDKLALFDGG
jgi:integrase